MSERLIKESFAIIMPDGQVARDDDKELSMFVSREAAELAMEHAHLIMQLNKCAALRVAKVRLVEASE